MADDKKPGVLSRAAETFRQVRSMWAVRAGIQFQGKRDTYKVFGYNPDPQWQDFWARYNRQDLASRVINKPVSATWSKRPTIGGQAQNPQLVSDLTTLDLSIPGGVWMPIVQSDILAGIGRYSVLFLGLDDSTDFSKPVTSDSCKLVYLRALSEASATIQTFDQNVNSPRFGMPLMYQISTTGLDAQGRYTTSNPNKIQVHFSRIIHIIEQPMESPVYGTPRLLNVWNLLDDLIKVVGGSAEMFWLSSNRGMQLDVDPTMNLSPDQEDALQGEAEEYQNELRRIMRTRGVTINPLGGTNPSPQQTFNMLIDCIAATTGIPQRILMGSEAGSLASAQDRANWADLIDDRRLNYAEPRILRPFLQSGNDYGFLRKSPNVTITWSPAYRLSPLEEDQRLAQRARAAVNFSKQPQMGMPIMSLEDCRAELQLPRKPTAGDTMPAFPIPPAIPAAGKTGSTNANPKPAAASTESNSDRTQGSTNSPAASGQSGARGNEEAA